MTDRNTRLLAAIMFTDIEGYTSLMQKNEAEAIRLRDRHREVMDAYHIQHKGKIVQYYGDGSLSIFNSCVEAVACAISIQKKLWNETPKVPLRIGIHLGDIIERDDDVIGNGVNIASRVESLSVPGSVMISQKVADEISNQSGVKLSSMGKFAFKNAHQLIEVFALNEEGLVLPDGKLLTGKFTKRKSQKKSPISGLPTWAKFSLAALLTLILGSAIYFLSPSNTSFSGNRGSSGLQTNSDLYETEASLIPIYSVAFENETKNQADDWLSLGIPYALALDWSQDFRMYNVFREEPQNKSLQRSLDEAKEERCDFLITGSYAKIEEQYRVQIRIYQSKNGQTIAEQAFMGTSLFDLLDSVSLAVKSQFRLGPPEGGAITDLPLAQFFTKSEAAFKSLSQGIILDKREPARFSAIQRYFKQAVEHDPSFAWGHYFLSNFLYLHNLSRPLSNKHIGLAMQNRHKLPKQQEAEIRQLQYRMQGEEENALKTSKFIYELQPNNAKLLNKFITELYRQNQCEEAIENIEKFRDLHNAPYAQMGMMCDCQIRLDNPDDAIDELQKYLEKYPGDVQAITWLGKAYLAEHDLEKARIAFDRVQLEHPESPEIPFLLKHLEYLEESETGDGNPRTQAQGMYWAAGMNLRSSHTIIHNPDNGQLYFQFNRSTTQKQLYPLGNNNYFHEGNYFNFIPNEDGMIDRMNSYEAYQPDQFYTSYRIDSDIMKAMNLFNQGDYDAAKKAFELSFVQHPEHIFLDYYLKHLTFRDSSAYALQREIMQNLTGTYATADHQYRISVENEQLFIQSPSNHHYLDPIPLLALSPHMYLDTYKLSYRLVFTLTNPQEVHFLNGDRKKIIAKFVTK